MSNIYKRYPADSIKNSGYLGIKLPMNSSQSDTTDSLFNMSRTTEEQAVSNYINLLLTKPGERYMQPEYGIGIQLYLFEQNTESLISSMRAIIEMQSQIWLPYIINRNIDIVNNVNDEGNRIGIAITFSVTEYGANQTLTLFNTNGKPEYVLSEYKGDAL